LLEELADVLARPKFSSRLESAGVTVGSLLAGINALATIITPEAIAPTVRADPDDDAVLACAMTASVARIVSGDSHLLELGGFQGIPIVTATELLAELDTQA
jgi:putative PIN family toxin of toxin-antitoxin system